MNEFDDIRPYHDDEVKPVLTRVLNDNEFLLAVSKFLLPSSLAGLAPLVKPLVKLALRFETRNVVDVRTFQDVIEKYMRRMIRKTTTAITCSGLDKLDKNTAYLFMSNHRDIAMDPAFVNWNLYHNGMDTVRIAIGDNLLTKPFASDLMRLNKSFLVRRSETAPRKIFAALKQLSAYISHSINHDKANIWIAQREGRAKDGNDRTEPAIIKMLAMNKPKEQSLADFIRSLHIVPVAISYELDPCDVAKARELYYKAEHGNYEKGEHEDVKSIALGIAGQKGHVHVSFGDVLSGDYATAEDVAAEIDRQVIGQYVLHPSNFFAYRRLKGDYPQGSYSDRKIPFNGEKLREEEAAFNQRIAGCMPVYQHYLLEMYANPVLSKQTQD